MRDMTWQTIFSVGFEGGSLTVLGRRDSAGLWHYTLVRDEAALLFLTNEFSAEEVYAECLASGWDEVLDELDVYPWTEFYPLGPFHPGHKIRILAAVAERGVEGYAPEWDLLCGGAEVEVP